MEMYYFQYHEQTQSKSSDLLISRSLAFFCQERDVYSNNNGAQN